MYEQSIQTETITEMTSRVFTTVKNVRVSQNNSGQVSEILSKLDKTQSTETFSLLFDNIQKTDQFGTRQYMRLIAVPTPLRVKVTTFSIGFLIEFVTKSLEAASLTNQVPQDRRRRQKKASVNQEEEKEFDNQPKFKEFCIEDFALELDLLTDAEIPDSHIPLSLIPNQKNLKIALPPLRMTKDSRTVDEILDLIQKRYISHIVKQQGFDIIKQILSSRKIVKIASVPYKILSDVLIKRKKSVNEVLTSIFKKKK